jgi:predicted MFS family arabinose efflux permease
VCVSNELLGFSEQKGHIMIARIVIAFTAGIAAAAISEVVHKWKTRRKNEAQADTWGEG